MEKIEKRWFGICYFAGKTLNYIKFKTPKKYESNV